MARRPFGPLLSEPRITRIAQVGCGAFCRLMLRHGLKGLRILVPSRVGGWTGCAEVGDGD